MPIPNAKSASRGQKKPSFSPFAKGSFTFLSPRSVHAANVGVRNLAGDANLAMKPFEPPGVAHGRLNPQLTKRAGQLGECKRLAAAGQQGAQSALFAATAALFKRAQFPRYWPFPPKRGLGLLAESADELEVGDIWLPKYAEVRGHS